MQLHNHNCSILLPHMLALAEAPHAVDASSLEGAHYIWLAWGRGVGGCMLHYRALPLLQFNILPIYDELRPSSKPRINTLIHLTMLGTVLMPV